MTWATGSSTSSPSTTCQGLFGPLPKFGRGSLLETGETQAEAMALCSKHLPRNEAGPRHEVLQPPLGPRESIEGAERDEADSDGGTR